jgi:hypothetical protein
MKVWIEIGGGKKKTQWQEVFPSSPGTKTWGGTSFNHL